MASMWDWVYIGCAIHGLIPALSRSSSGLCLHICTSHVMQQPVSMKEPKQMSCILKD